MWGDQKLMFEQAPQRKLHLNKIYQNSPMCLRSSWRNEPENERKHNLTTYLLQKRWTCDSESRGRFAITIWNTLVKKKTLRFYHSNSCSTRNWQKWTKSIVLWWNPTKSFVYYRKLMKNNTDYVMCSNKYSLFQIQPQN